MNRCETCQESIPDIQDFCAVCGYWRQRRFRDMDFTLDLRSAVKFEIEVRLRNLKRSGHYIAIREHFIDGVKFFLLYKSPMPTQARYYPLFGRMQV